MAVDVATMLKLGFKIVHAPTGQDVIDLLIAIRAEARHVPARPHDRQRLRERERRRRGVPRGAPDHPSAQPAAVRRGTTPPSSGATGRSRPRPNSTCRASTLPSTSSNGSGSASARAVDRLNHHRRRESREWKTAAQLDIDLPRPYTVVARDVFYAVASAAMRMARDSPGSTRQQRLAERWALYTVMEGFGLIKLFRGGVPITALKAEGLT